MPVQIKIKPSAPLLIGGREKAKYMRKTMDYVPGSVLRAAVSRELVQQCSFGSAEGKINWVQYRDQPACGSCAFAAICKQFDKICFGALMPHGARFLPVTALICKAHCRQAVYQDQLLDLLQDSAILPACPCGGRLERAKGLIWFDNQQKRWRSVSCQRHTVTKVAIDPYRQTAQDGLLYSLEVLSGTVRVGDASPTNNIQKADVKPLELIGQLDVTGEEQAVLKSLTRLLCDRIEIGAYTSSGFGACEITAGIIEEQDHAKAMKGRIERFSTRLHQSSLPQNGLLLPITLLTDACLPVTTGTKRRSQLTNDDYLALYGQLFDDCGFPVKVVRTLAQFELRRGFDTSAGQACFRQTSLYARAGSVLVIQVDPSVGMEALFNLQTQGIGENKRNGYGKIKIADSFHVQ